METFNPIVLRRFRSAFHRKIPLRELAEVLGCSVGSYGKKERGEIQVSIDDLTKLADFYKVPVAEFFGDPSHDHISQLLEKVSGKIPTKEISVDEDRLYTLSHAHMLSDITQTYGRMSRTSAEEFVTPTPVNYEEEIASLREQVLSMSQLMTQFRKQAMQLEQETRRLKADLNDALAAIGDCEKCRQVQCNKNPAQAKPTEK